MIVNWATMVLWPDFKNTWNTRWISSVHSPNDMQVRKCSLVDILQTFLLLLQFSFVVLHLHSQDSSKSHQWVCIHSYSSDWHEGKINFVKHLFKCNCPSSVLDSSKVTLLLYSEHDHQNIGSVISTTLLALLQRLLLQRCMCCAIVTHPQSYVYANQFIANEFKKWLTHYISQ